jgi:hypothetical protein
LKREEIASAEKLPRNDRVILFGNHQHFEQLHFCYNSATPTRLFMEIPFGDNNLIPSGLGLGRHKCRATHLFVEGTQAKGQERIVHCLGDGKVLENPAIHGTHRWTGSVLLPAKAGSLKVDWPFVGEGSASISNMLNCFAFCR